MVSTVALVHHETFHLAAPVRGPPGPPISSVMISSKLFGSLPLFGPKTRAHVGTVHLISDKRYLLNLLS